jgi:predicted phage terminase large subunit-like protein
VLSLDPSKGGQDKGDDYQAFCRWGADGRGVEWFEGDLCRLDIQALAERAVAHVVAFKPDVFVVEGNTFQELLGPIFTAEALRQGITLPLEFLDNTVNKQVRIRRLTEPLAQRKGRFKARSPGTQLMVQQMRDFPTGDHNDGPDAAEMARRVGLELVSGRRRPRKPERLRA